MRCRETFQREILKSRHYILKFLARRGFVFRDGTNWCTPHLRWLRHLTTEHVAARARPIASCFASIIALLEVQAAATRRARSRRSRAWPSCRRSRRSCCGCSASAGLPCTGAMVLATEIVDWRRFERPTQLAAYLGLVSREDSSGDRERKGSITKAGNSHCRTCWSKRRGAITSAGDQRRISSGARRANRRR